MQFLEALENYESKMKEVIICRDNVAVTKDKARITSWKDRELTNPAATFVATRPQATQPPFFREM